MERGFTSILVPVFNNLHCVELLHRTLDRQTPGHLWELILIDNGSTEPGVEDCYARLEADARVSVIRNDTNRGFGRANNQGLAQARGEFIGLINSDMFFVQPWLEAMLERLVADPQCGAVQGRILLAQENTPLSDWTTQTCGACFDRNGLPQYHLADHPSAAPEVNQAFLLQAFMGTGVLLRRSVIEAVGFFDEGYDIVFMEDTDLSLRISQAGHRILYEPRALFIHLHSASMPHLSQEDYDRSRKFNLERFRGKWPLERVRAIVEGQGFGWEGGE
ncbi:MAG: glycosyltransferase family 2 protein [Magnetococcales bacterium]|nr:glycosyltransferase family 2 protein [Magnetococcales bacterium]